MMQPQVLFPPADTFEIFQALDFAASSRQHDIVCAHAL